MQYLKPELTYIPANARITLATINAVPAMVLALYTQGLGGFRNQRPLAKAALDTTFGVANSNDVVMPLTTGVVDTDGMWSSLSPNQLTVQTPGWYRLVLQQHWGAGGSGQRACKIMVNGTNPNLNAVAADSRTATGGIGCTLACEGLAHLDYGSTIYVNAFQLSGSTQNLVSSNGGSFLSAEFVAP